MRANYFLKSFKNIHTLINCIINRCFYFYSSATAVAAPVSAIASGADGGTGGLIGSNLKKISKSKIYFENSHEHPKYCEQKN